jgi:malonate transporter
MTSTPSFTGSHCRRCSLSIDNTPVALRLFLVSQRVTARITEVGWVTFFKLFFQPALVWWLAFYVIEMEQFWAFSPAALRTLPAGALVFVTAQQNGVYLQQASAGIVMTTVISLVTLAALLAWIGLI